MEGCERLGQNRFAGCGDRSEAQNCHHTCRGEGNPQWDLDSELRSKSSAEGINLGTVSTIPETALDHQVRKNDRAEQTV